MIMRAKEAPAPPPKTWVPRNANWCRQPFGPQGVRQWFELAIYRTPAQAMGPTFPSSILIQETEVIPKADHEHAGHTIVRRP